MTEQELERRGEAARRILNDELFKEAFEAIETQLVNMIAADPKRGEYLGMYIDFGRKYRRWMEQVLVSGTLAAQDIERRSKFQEWRDKARRRWA